MKKIIYILAAFHILITCDTFSQSGWVWQNPLPQGNDAYDIKMFNSGTGFCRTNSNVLKTTNFGTNWQIVSYLSENIMDIFFVNEQMSYLLSGDYRYISNLYKSTNGGINWQLVFQFNDIKPNELYWLNATTGFVNQRSAYFFGSKIHKTTNGGLSWFNVFNDTTIEIRAISFPSVNIGYIAGKTLNAAIFTAKFFKSTNGGNNWDSSTIHGVRELNSVYFLNEQSGYISGPRIYSGPCLLRTTTGGLTWDSVYYPSISSFYFRKLEFLNFNTGYGGTLYKTTNAGVNWLLLNPYIGAGLFPGDFSVYDTQNIFICGLGGTLGKSTNGGLNWTSNSGGFYGFLYSIKFFDANTGIAVGGNSSGMVLRTTNSGLLWDTTNIDSYELNNIYLYNANTAFVAGAGKVFKTTNKGESFSILNTYTFIRWDDVCFPNENTGYTVHKYRVVDKTTNGGNTWVNVLPMNGQAYFTLSFINGNTGFIGGSAILKTTNGGTSWDTVNTGQSDYFCNKLSYINGTIYSLGYRYLNPYTKGVLLTSSDLGLNWQVDSSQNDNYLYDISIPAANIIYLMGSRYIHKSVNNSNWLKYDPFIDSYYYNSISFVNADTGFISTYTGGILKTTNGGGTPIGIIPNTNEIPDKFSLLQNYPNPFNPSTKIEFSLPKSTFVTIKVYDLLGRFIKLLVNENKSPGNYSVNFDGSNFASGVYFYTIETPEFIQSKKMVLLK